MEYTKIGLVYSFCVLYQNKNQRNYIIYRAVIAEHNVCMGAMARSIGQFKAGFLVSIPMNIN